MEKCCQTDLTDARWGSVRLHVYAATGQPPSVDRREVVNAVLYQTRTGRRWRMLSKDFPYRSTVRSCFWR